MTATSRREFLEGLDPASLLQIIDDHFDDANESPFRRLYLDARQRFLEREGDHAVKIAALLDEVDDMALVEAAIKNAGFVLGFEACRQILLGELQLPTVDGAAAADQKVGGVA